MNAECQEHKNKNTIQNNDSPDYGFKDFFVRSPFFFIVLENNGGEYIDPIYIRYYFCMFLAPFSPTNPGVLETVGPSPGEWQSYRLLAIGDEFVNRIFWIHIWIDTDDNDINPKDNRIHFLFAYNRQGEYFRVLFHFPRIWFRHWK